MKELLLRLPAETKTCLEMIKKEERRPLATIVREAIDRYLKERRAQDALDWFVNKYCKKCNNNCKVGSLAMVECMLKKMDEKEGKNEATIS